MATKYISTADVDGLIGARVRSSLFDDGDGYLASSMSRLIVHASALVEAAGDNAGYAIGTATTNPMVIMATLGQLLFLAYNRKQQTVPEQYASLVNMTGQIATGAIALTGLEAAGRPAVGGSDWSDTNSTSTGSTHRVLGSTKLRRFY